ncbi:hypothetical protein NMG60_11014877 [Bertholletia excelsa]
MFKDKSPGVKILWLWTIGTAAILVTNVARTRLRDMEKLMEAEEAPTGAVDPATSEGSPNFPEFDEEKKS